MVLFLDLWSAVILGILYLFFGGVPYIFRTQYGLLVSRTECISFWTDVMTVLWSRLAWRSSASDLVKSRRSQRNPFSTGELTSMLSGTTYSVFQELPPNSRS